MVKVKEDLEIRYGKGSLHESAFDEHELPFFSNTLEIEHNKSGFLWTQDMKEITFGKLYKVYITFRSVTGQESITVLYVSRKYVGNTNIVVTPIIKNPAYPVVIGTNENYIAVNNQNGLGARTVKIHIFEVKGMKA